MQLQNRKLPVHALRLLAIKPDLKEVVLQDVANKSVDSIMNHGFLSAGIREQSLGKRERKHVPNNLIGGSITLPGPSCTGTLPQPPHTSRACSRMKQPSHTQHTGCCGGIVPLRRHRRIRDQCSSACHVPSDSRDCAQELRASTASTQTNDVRSHVEAASQAKYPHLRSWLPCERQQSWRTRCPALQHSATLRSWP